MLVLKRYLIHTLTIWAALTNRILLECEAAAVAHCDYAVYSAGGAHRMELSGELVLGLQPVGRKSKAVV